LPTSLDIEALSSHFRRPGPCRRDGQVRGQRPSWPRLADSESPPAGPGNCLPCGEPTGGFHTPAD
jgi:hypothetical protein